MVTTIRLSAYSPRPNIITFLLFLLLSGLLLFKLRDSTVDRTTFRIDEISQNSRTTSKTGLHSDPNQPSISPSYVCDKLGPLNNHSSILSPYCAKIPVPIDGWTRAEKYTESDIVFLIVSTDMTISHAKATAVHDTWLSRVTHKYFLSNQSYSSSLTSAVNETNDTRTSNMKRIFYGLQTIYNQQKTSSNPYKWYYLGGSNTFINVPHVLKKLDSYDSNKPFFLGGLSNITTCLDDRGQQHEIEVPSSDAGYFISSKLLATMMPQLTDSMQTISSQNSSDTSSIVLSCLIYKLGIGLTNLSGYWIPNADRSSASTGENDEQLDPEPNNFPSLSSAEIYDLDEFYSFLHVDRLVNDQNWKELTDYFRLFVSSHYETLRMRRNEDMS